MPTPKLQQQNKAIGGGVIPPAPNAIPPKVVEMAQQNFAMRNGGELPPSMQGSPNGNVPPVASVPNMDYFGQGGRLQGAFDYTPATPAPAPEYGTQGVQFTNPANPQQNDLNSLSQALANAGVSRQTPQFQADPNQRDGGFFGWLGSILPKKRPGMREGETPDDYDRRMTQNSQRYFLLADAIRHMGNIINTTKGAPSQTFNDPSSMIEAGYQQRRANRQKQDALDADAAYKQASMGLKERAQQAADAYKQLQLQLGLDKFNYQQGKDANDFDYKQKRDAANDAYKEKNFNADQQQRATSNALREASIAKRGSGKGGGGRGGSGPKYVTWDKDGKPHFAWNQTMWEQDQGYYNGNTSGKSSTSNSKEVLGKDGSSTRVTNRQGGSSVAQRAGALRRQREQAKKNAKASTKGNGKKLLGGKKYH